MSTVQNLVIINHCNRLISIELTVVKTYTGRILTRRCLRHTKIQRKGMQRKYEYLKIVTGTMLHFEKVKLALCLR